METILLKRGDFQALAEEGLADVQSLLDRERFGAAYYLAGYIVEFALKSCIAKRTTEHEFPPKDAGKLYTHNLLELERRSGLQETFGKDRKSDPDLAGNWEIVGNWSEDSRYERRSAEEAKSICAAVADPDHGVFACIKRYW